MPSLIFLDKELPMLLVMVLKTLSSSSSSSSGIVSTSDCSQWWRLVASCSVNQSNHSQQLCQPIKTAVSISVNQWKPQSVTLSTNQKQLASVNQSKPQNLCQPFKPQSAALLTNHTTVSSSVNQSKLQSATLSTNQKQSALLSTNENPSQHLCQPFKPQSAALLTNQTTVKLQVHIGSSDHTNLEQRKLMHDSSRVVRHTAVRSWIWCPVNCTGSPQQCRMLLTLHGAIDATVASNWSQATVQFTADDIHHFMIKPHQGKQIWTNWEDTQSPKAELLPRKKTCKIMYIWKRVEKNICNWSIQLKSWNWPYLNSYQIGSIINH